MNLYESYDSNKALSYENHMKGASYVNQMNHICVLYLCNLYSLKNQVTWFTVNFKTFNLSKVLFSGQYASLI